MRIRTTKVANAFDSNTPLKNGNDKVTVTNGVTEMFLHGHLIAVKTKNKTRITNAGWQTNVTKDRLNTIKGVSINQSKGVWYLNGKEWDGSWVEVK